MPDSFVHSLEYHPAQRQMTYRAYELTPEGGLCSVEILNVGSDDEAQAFAAAMRSPYGIELWERGRFLGRFEPRP